MCPTWLNSCTLSYSYHIYSYNMRVLQVICSLLFVPPFLSYYAPYLPTPPPLLPFILIVQWPSVVPHLCTSLLRAGSDISWNLLLALLYLHPVLLGKGFFLGIKCEILSVRKVTDEEWELSSVPYWNSSAACLVWWVDYHVSRAFFVCLCALLCFMVLRDSCPAVVPSGHCPPCHLHPPVAF